MPWARQLTRLGSGEVYLDSFSDPEEYDLGFSAPSPADQTPALTDGYPVIAAYEPVNKCEQLTSAIAARSSLAPPQAYDVLRGILDRRWKHINFIRNILHNKTN